MAKAAKPAAAGAAPVPALQWNVNAADQKPIVSEDGTNWRFATDAEIAARDAAALAPAPASLAPAPVPAPTAAPAPAPAGFALVPGTGEQIPTPGQEVIMDGKHKEGQITLSSPVGSGVMTEPELVASLQKQVNDRIAERDAKQATIDRLMVVNSQLRETNAVQAKHIAELQGRENDSMGLPKTPGM